MRREFLYLSTLLCAASCAGDESSSSGSGEGGDGYSGTRPNVIFILTDDQGYGDVECLGNEVIKTPNMDAIHAASVRMTDFHVSPVSAPTRGSLISGLYANHSGVWSTTGGREILNDECTTLPEILKGYGYATSMFGKWHLGDTEPYSPECRGFDETLYHLGGGIDQTPGYYLNDMYGDTLVRNGEDEKQDENDYTTDVFFDNAMEFIKTNHAAEKPFFCWLAPNAPHGPLWVDKSYSDPYRGNKYGVDAEYYGMIANIDENIGRLNALIDELGIRENTILIFATDNGTENGAEFNSDEIRVRGYNAGMRGEKGSTYDGGHRVPLFISWKGNLQSGVDLDNLMGSIDFMPTILGFCGIESPDNIDGVDMSSDIMGLKDSNPDRVIVVDSQRDDEVVKYKRYSVMSKEWRLVNPKANINTELEFYDIKNDPGQTNNLANDEKYAYHIATFKAEYESWWAKNEVAYDKRFSFKLGSDYGSTTMSAIDIVGTSLYTMDKVLRGDIAKGYWAVEVAESGLYRFELYRYPPEAGLALNAAVKTQHLPSSAGGGESYTAGVALNIQTATLRIQGLESRTTVDPSSKCATIVLDLEAGETQLEAIFNEGVGGTGKDSERAAYYIKATKI